MKDLVYADIELPRAPVQKIIKNASEGKLVQKEAKTACVKAATVFISYLTAAAQDVAASQTQKTLNANHMLQAIEMIGFGPEFLPVLTEKLEQFKRNASLAKEAKQASSNTVVNVDGEDNDDGDDDAEDNAEPSEFPNSINAQFLPNMEGDFDHDDDDEEATQLS